MHYNPNAIGLVIRRLRKKKNLSQEVCSGLAGIARSHLSMIETGDICPNLETLWKLADALELRPSELVAFIEQESSSSADLQ